MTLTLQQNDVFEKFKSFLNDANSQVFILRGYAGTGKTTMVKVLSDYIKDHVKDYNPVLMAPTGRAARILRIKTGIAASTIHRAIYQFDKFEEVSEEENTSVKYYFAIRQPDETGRRFLSIVDEASMVCSKTVEHEVFQFGSGNVLEDLFTFTRTSFGGKVIFVGDPAQLPPVGESASNALSSDYFKEKGMKVVEAELTEVLRQQGDSVILKNAMMIRDLLSKEKRNEFLFAEKESEVERVAANDFLSKYIAYRKESGRHDSVVICYSNKTATKYNQEIRHALYGEELPLQKDDVLLVTQNNYRANRMNGEFIRVLSVGERVTQSAPVWVQAGPEKKKVTVELKFISVVIEDGDGNEMPCMLLEDFLTSEHASLTKEERTALYVNFKMRKGKFLPKSDHLAFASALMQDEFYNAIRAKYGYAVTGHKCQGGEWGKVFVDYTGRTGLDNDSLRWAYTTTTRARNTLYVTNLPNITPFSKFRIDPIQKCKHVAQECRVLLPAKPTPFHDEDAENFLKAKYHCICDNMKDSDYRIVDVTSKPYLEIYTIQTPDGPFRYDIHYKAGGIFQPSKACVTNKHTETACKLLDDEHSLEIAFDYTPSDDTNRNLYNLMQSVCDTQGVTITNVVEHPEDFSVVYYLRTCGTISYIKFYIDKKGFVTYAKPSTMATEKDGDLESVTEEIQRRFE